MKRKHQKKWTPAQCLRDIAAWQKRNPGWQYDIPKIDFTSSAK